jgi:hypothetical protein
MYRNGRLVMWDGFVSFVNYFCAVHLKILDMHVSFCNANNNRLLYFFHHIYRIPKSII